MHRILFLKPILIAAVILAFAGLIFYALDLRNSLSTETVLLIWVAVLVIAAVPVLGAALSWYSAEFAVTK